MNHKKFLLTLSGENRTSLNKTYNILGLLHFAAYFGLMTGFAVLIWMKVPYWPALMLPLGILGVLDMFQNPRTVFTNPNVLFVSANMPHILTPDQTLRVTNT